MANFLNLSHLVLLARFDFRASFGGCNRVSRRTPFIRMPVYFTPEPFRASGKETSGWPCLSRKRRCGAPLVSR